MDQANKDVNIRLLDDNRKDTSTDQDEVGSTTNNKINSHHNQVKLLKFVILSLSLFATELFFAILDNFCIPLQLKAHVPIQFCTILFSCVSIIGVLVSPVVGNLSDCCSSQFGRRRPYIVGLFIISFVAEMAAIYGRQIGLLITPHCLILGQIIVIIGLIVAYIAVMTLMIPTRAIVMDITPPDMHSTASSILTFMGCSGELLGFVICGINWNMTILAKVFEGRIQASFIVVSLFAIFTVSVAILSYKETPLERQTEHIDSKNNKEPLPINVDNEKEEHLQLITTHDYDRLSENRQSTHEDMKSANSQLTLEHIRSRNILYQVFYYTKTMPKELVILFFTSLLGWLTFSTFALFYTNFVGQAIMKGNPFAAENSTALHKYDIGIRYGSWGLVLGTIVNIIYSIIAKQLICYFDPKYVHAFGFLVTCIATAVMAFSNNVIVVTCLASFQGIGFYSVFTIPFAILGSYREYFDEKKDERWIFRDYGIDISILINSSLLNYIIASFAATLVLTITNSSRSAMVLSAIYGGLCAISSLFIYTIPAKSSVKLPDSS